MNAFDITTLCIGIVAFALAFGAMAAKRQTTATIYLCIGAIALIAVDQDLSHHPTGTAAATHHSKGAP